MSGKGTGDGWGKGGGRYVSRVCLTLCPHNAYPASLCLPLPSHAPSSPLALHNPGLTLSATTPAVAQADKKRQREEDKVARAQAAGQAKLAKKTEVEVRRWGRKEATH